MPDARGAQLGTHAELLPGLAVLAFLDGHGHEGVRVVGLDQDLAVAVREQRGAATARLVS